jgi:hypothetical protein
MKKKNRLHLIEGISAMQQNLSEKPLSRPQHKYGGLPVRTGLRGGVCVDVNDQIKAALQTLTNALGGATTVAATPTTAGATVTTSS